VEQMPEPMRPLPSGSGLPFQLSWFVAKSEHSVASLHGQVLPARPEFPVFRQSGKAASCWQRAAAQPFGQADLPTAGRLPQTLNVMKSWELPSRRTRGKKPRPERVGFRERIIAAIVAPVAFNFSIFVLFGMFGRGRGGFRWFHVYPLGVSLVLVIAPAVAGFLLGFERFATFFGHCFHTNPEGQGNWWVTVSIWVALLLLLLGISKLPK
jgi:hypothetical protein